MLSNNDGCIVARSNEVKALGIKMGEPYFKLKDTLRRNKVQVFSSNYALYADMSNRVMQTLSQFTNELEVYSIDEGFMMLGEHDDHLPPEMVKTVQQWTGIPVTVGVGPTKTLAKIAAHVAKRDPSLRGVFEVTSESDEILRKINVKDIWGIGPRYALKLYSCGVVTAYDLKMVNDAWARKMLTVQGLRTVEELRGTPCINLEHQPQPKKSIVCSRSFGHKVSSKQELAESLATYATTAAEKLRKGKQCASAIQVFAQLHPYDPENPGMLGVSFQFPEPTSYTPDIIQHVMIGLESLFIPGMRYKKAGVLLTGLVPDNEVQLNLFNPVEDISQKKELMVALDKSNQKWGRGTVSYAACGMNKRWEMKRERMSPRYTTSWAELPKVKAI